MKDSEGTPRAAGELLIRPADFAKIGQLMLDDGVWQGTRIVPEGWVKRSTAAGQSLDESCGLLWWRLGTFANVVDDPLLAAWHDAGVTDEVLRPLRALKGQKFDREQYRDGLLKTVGADGLRAIDAAVKNGNHVPFSDQVAAGPIQGFAAEGWLGQFIVVIPGSHLVAVRMRRGDAVDFGDEGSERFGFDDFPKRVQKLFPQGQ